MNRFECPKCGKSQFSSSDNENTPCIYCGNTPVQKTKDLSQNEVNGSEPYKIIATDFDGTLFEDKWPEIGEPNTVLIDYLKKRQEQGDKLVLWTCRCGDRLDAAVKQCEEHGLIFDAVNENLPEAIEMFGDDSRKIFAHEYIDDKNAWPLCTVFNLPFLNEEY